MNWSDMQLKQADAPRTCVYKWVENAVPGINDNNNNNNFWKEN